MYFLQTLFILLFTVTGAYGQTRSYNYTVKLLTQKDGFFSNGILECHEDKNGYLWIVGENGLYRYDGISVKVFNKSNTPFLGYTFGDISLDEHQNIIVNDWEGNTADIITDSLKGSFPAARKNKIVKGGNYTNGYGIDQLEFNNFLKAHFTEQEQQKISNNSASFFGLPNGSFYVKFRNKLWYVSRYKEAVVYTHTDSNFTFKNLFLLKDSILISVEDKNRVYAFVKGVLIDKIKNIAGPIAANSFFLQSGSVVTWNKNSTYVLTDDKKLYSINFENGILSSQLIFENLSIANVTNIYYSSARNCYYFASLDGLYVVKAAAFFKPAIKVTIFSQLEVLEKMILGKNCLYERNSTRVTDYFLSNKNIISGYLLDKKKELWYGDRKLIFKKDFVTKKTLFQKELESEVVEIFKSSYNSLIYVLTYTNLYIFNGEELEEVKGFSKHFSYYDNYVSHIAQLNAQEFLLATSQGIHTFNSVNKQLTTMVSDANCLSIYKDKDSHYWITSTGAGIFLYKNNSITKVPLDEKEYLRFAYNIIEDRHHYFWISTAKGLFCINKMQWLIDTKTNKKILSGYLHFTTEDGLLQEELNGAGANCMLLLSDGDISVPSNKGIVIFNPEKARSLKRQNINTTIYIDKIFIDDNAMIIDSIINLKHNYRLLQITVSSVTNDDDALEFRIKAIDNEQWRPINKNGVIAVSRLLPGNYTIEIRSKNNSSLNIRTVNLYVETSFFASWKFIILIAGLSILLFAAIIKLRVKVLKAQKKRLEQVVQKKTAALNNNLKQLQITLDTVKSSEAKLLMMSNFRDKLNSMILHDVRSPLRFINSVTNYVSKNATTMNTTDLQNQLKELSSATSQLYNFSEEVMTWVTAMQRDDFSVIPVPFSLKTVINEEMILYQQLIYQNGNTLTQLNTDIILHTDKRIFAVVLRNLIDNANKNTRNGEISITCASTDKVVVININDNGNGIPADMVNAFNNGDLSNEIFKGIGLPLIYDLLGKLGIKAFIKSAPAKGTSFKLTIYLE
jgi:signal transduction histidine kinase